MDKHTNVTSNFFHLPAALVHAKSGEGKTKTTSPAWKLMLLGIFAGMFIAFGAASSSYAIHAIENPSIAKLISGLVFPVGLLMIILIGGELFTGNCMMIIGTFKREYTISQMIKVLFIVYIGNLLGSLMIVGLVFLSGQFNATSGLLGAFTIKIATAKVSLSFIEALSSGILCNILVCIAVLMSSASKDVAGKVFAVLFPIMTFVVSGYEHCVANMYYIPAGILALTNNSYYETAASTYGLAHNAINALNMKGFLLHNLLPVTIGNIIGGMMFVSIPLFLVHKKSNSR